MIARVQKMIISRCLPFHIKLQLIDIRAILLILMLILLSGSGCVIKDGGSTPSKAGRQTAVLPGPFPGGGVLLPNQWLLRPVGRQLLLGDFPVNIAMHPSGRYAAILHCGYGQHEIIVVNITQGVVVTRTPVAEAFYGIAFSPDGRVLVASGAGDEVIRKFDFNNGFLSQPEEIKLREKAVRGVPAGMAFSSDGQRLYVANVWGHKITEVSLAEKKVSWELALSSNRTEKASIKPAPASESFDEAAIRKRAEALLDTTGADDPFPYTCVVDENRGRIYASLWNAAAVSVVDLKERRELARWKTEEHPNEMLLSRSGRHLYVANANRNSVSVLDTESGQTVEILVAEISPYSLPGNTPNSLAFSPDESFLFVANADINAVAVFDISQPGKSRSLGFIPAGWYPTSVRLSKDGRRLLIANGKGIISKSNRLGPQPEREAPSTVREYIGGLLQGTLSMVDLQSGEKFLEQMKRFTATALSCRPAIETNQIPPGNPIPLRAGDPTPLKYCIYVIKENRTYDQILGDMPEGNGDASLCLFGEKVTPNHHALAREFVLLDNFYVEGEVSADGHEWTMGAYATDFVEKSWPMAYGHNKSKKFSYPSEGSFAIAAPAGGYLWDRAKEAGVSYRSYGEFIQNGKTTNDPGIARVAGLRGKYDPWFRGFDVDYSDLKRAERFLAELKRFEQEGQMPRLQIVRLPNDHTAGSSAGKLTPTAYVAENDLALGMLVEGISRSKFWPQTAIFVVEDDAQNGPDHVDAHRSVAFVISPYTKRGVVDSTFYSTCSMLRTMELILGLKPMSQFDAAARPMYNSFQSKPDYRPYRCRPAQASLHERNSPLAWGADLSRQMDFTKEDAADDLMLNRVIWHSVKGPDVPMPAPKRAAFVFNYKKDLDDD